MRPEHGELAGADWNVLLEAQGQKSVAGYDFTIAFDSRGGIDHLSFAGNRGWLLASVCALLSVTLKEFQSTISFAMLASAARFGSTNWGNARALKGAQKSGGVANT